MKLAHTIKLSVFVNEGESEPLVLGRIKELLPVDFELEKIHIEKRTVEGLHGNKIIILELNIDKEKHTTLFIETLVGKLSQQQKELLLRQAESRLDEDLNFFMRLDKDKLLEKNEYFITQSGNCFHLKMHIASFPAKRQNAMEVLRGFLGKTISSQQLF